MKNMHRTLWVVLILTPMMVLAAPVTSSQAANLANNAPAVASTQAADLANNVPAAVDNSQERVFTGAGDTSVGDNTANPIPTLPFSHGSSGMPDVITMLLTLDKSFPALTFMVSGMAYLFGFGIMIKAIWSLKSYGMGVSMTAHNDIRPIIMQLIVGTLLIFMVSTLKSLLATLYGTDAITAYQHIPDTTWKVAADTMVIFMQFIGLVAVVRGLLHLHKASNGQSQQNGFAKGIIHLVGGTLSLNIIQTKNILYSTLGLTT